MPAREGPAPSSSCHVRGTSPRFHSSAITSRGSRGSCGKAGGGAVAVKDEHPPPGFVSGAAGVIPSSAASAPVSPLRAREDSITDFAAAHAGVNAHASLEGRGGAAPRNFAPPSAAKAFVFVDGQGRGTPSVAAAAAADAATVISVSTSAAVAAVKVLPHLQRSPAYKNRVSAVLSLPPPWTGRPRPSLGTVCVSDAEVAKRAYRCIRDGGFEPLLAVDLANMLRSTSGRPALLQDIKRRHGG